MVTMGIILIITGICLIIIWIRQVRRIGNYEKAVRSVLGKGHADCFDWEVMKIFYDQDIGSYPAAMEMIAAGKGKTN